MAGKIGFIGLGNMGAKMALCVWRETGSLLVRNASGRLPEELKVKGVAMAADTRQIALECDVIFLAVPGPAEVREVVGGEEGLLINGRQGQFLIDLSTIDPTTSQEMAEQAHKAGITYVDVPVSGGVANAAIGALTMMAGAREEELAEVMPYLRAIGKTHYFIGKRGGGSAIKIINNFMAFCIQLVNAEAILLTDHLDIPFDTFFSAVNNSTGGNTILRNKGEQIKSGNIEPGFAVDLVIKDLELAAQLCRECGISNFSLNLALQFYRMAQQRGYGKKDSTSIIKLIRELEPKA